MPVKPIPEGYHALTPYLVLRDAARAITFYERALGAKELFRMAEPDGRIGHAELRIGDSHLMLADEHPEMGARGPPDAGTGVVLLLYVEDVDATIARAVAAGARVTRPVEDRFYGDRSGGIVDPFGHTWMIATHVEDVTPEELERRAAAQRPA